MPVEPVDPSKKTSGNGSEKYTPPSEKRGPSEFDKIAERVDKENAEKAKAEKARAEISKMSEKTRSEPKYTGKAYSETGPTVGPRTSGGFGGGGSGGDTKFLKPKYKAGGKVSSASKRADGCCIRGKTKA
jgi:hypothetical protein